jgi:hypothetical protein
MRKIARITALILAMAAGSCVLTAIEAAVFGAFGARPPQILQTLSIGGGVGLAVLVNRNRGWWL